MGVLVVFGTLRIYAHAIKAGDASPHRLGRYRVLTEFRLAVRVLFCVAAVQAGVAKAADIAFDNAADPTYNASWDPLSNGGFGWGAGWEFSGSAGGSQWWSVATAPNGFVNSPAGSTGRAWKLQALTTGQVTTATRTLNGALNVGQSILADFVYPVPADQFAGAEFQIQSHVFVGGSSFNNVRLIGVSTVFGSSSYKLTDGSGTRSTGIPTTSGLHLQFTLTDPSSYSLTLTPLIDGSATQTFTGSLPAPPVTIPPTPPYPVTQIYFFDGSESVGAAPMYLNNIAVTPEPTGLATLACMTFLLRRSRRDAD
jgi:hypothetical protein